MLFRDENYNVLEKMKEDHRKKIQKMKLQKDLDIERSKLKNELTLEKLKSEKSQIDIKREIFNLKNLVNKDSLTQKAGKKLKFWAILVTLVSTFLTIAGGYNLFNKNIYTLVAFISAVIILQLTVYIISSQETRIKQDFNRHFSKCMLLKYSLLTISIYNNYKFFEPENGNFVIVFITILLCVAMDLIAVFIVALAYDQITLNFSKSSGENLFLSLLANLKNKYQETKTKVFEEVEPGFGKSILSFTDKELEKYLDFAKANKDKNGFIPAYKTIGQAVGLSRNKASDIKKYLDNSGKTKVSGSRTKLLV